MFIIALFIGTLGLLFPLLLIHSITFCCVAEFLAPLLIDSLTSFKVCIWGLKKCKFLHTLFFLFEVQPVILPLKSFPTGCLALFTLVFVWRLSYIFSFKYLKYSSLKTELLNYLATYDQVATCKDEDGVWKKPGYDFTSLCWEHVMVSTMRVRPVLGSTHKPQMRR